MGSPFASLLTLSAKSRSLCQIPVRSFVSRSGTDIKVDQTRLWSDIHHSCQWGSGERWGSGVIDTGMSRLALSDSDRQARDWFVETSRSLGCNVTVDEMGNIFATKQGRREGPPTYAGSHLDTQPAGGRYDGILGVCAGLEMLRALNDAQFETEYPIGVINWTNEEGARFPISMISSGVWAGEIPLERAQNLVEVGAGKQTIKQELKRIGYLGKAKASFDTMPIGGHFELHIEQGPRLESKNCKIGIVEGVQAYRWHTITVVGRDCHTGTTDFANRSDALLSAAKMILHSHRLGTSHSCMASTGILSVSPGSTNTVPGRVKFSLDIRAGEEDRLRAFEEDLIRDFERIARNEPVGGLNQGGTLGKECRVKWTLDTLSKATKFDKDCIRCVQQSSKDLLGDKYEFETEILISGAGHDSVYTSKKVPTAMIFVPCKDGVSHNPQEYCSPEDCANGAQVLMGAILHFDKHRAESKI